ncbi:hypothetical protein B0T26DRAFT_689746 [Lasiosphaeria miniovina]|uniref:Uncharacterized protein n=1 Tax=Lasiosphaeria miniovina TaxID=1954250 RepID=A0AA40EAW0_9PEZI|nr:uncharacterized protein B0T26DRAFT_689746 [Lasiosphaeria miniovina]KAK0734824.1 hypothetical protein B0T26DRAFT_689746 [Lasiosphaeria miniovina]
MLPIASYLVSVSFWLSRRCRLSSTFSACTCPTNLLSRHLAPTHIQRNPTRLADVSFPSPHCLHACQTYTTDHTINSIICLPASGWTIS